MTKYAADKHYLKLLEKYLGPSRVSHSASVAKAARELAGRYAPELAEKAGIAGLLHDNAKGLRATKLIELAEQFDIEVTRAEQAFPSLLHGKVGAALLAKRFDVDDAEIAQSVADHVTGRYNMGPLSRILFVADQIASDREFDGVDKLRKAATENLDQAVLIVAGNKLKYVITKRRIIEPMTVEVYNEFWMRVSRHGA